MIDPTNGAPDAAGHDSDELSDDEMKDVAGGMNVASVPGGRGAMGTGSMGNSTTSGPGSVI